MNETSKAAIRRLHTPGYATRYFVRKGIDVGCGQDTIGGYRHLFPLMTEVDGWDIEHGDAQLLPGVADGAYDWLHSSHCLEHLIDPYAALRRWCEVVNPGGHLVVLVPDEKMYEHGYWPSRFNPTHRWTFGLSRRPCVPGPQYINVLDLANSVGDMTDVLKMELLEHTFRSDCPGSEDQTLNAVAECAIEFVLRRL